MFNAPVDFCYANFNGPLVLRHANFRDQVKFAGDLSQFETLHAEASLKGDRLRRGDYETTNLSVAAEWTNQTLRIEYFKFE